MSGRLDGKVAIVTGAGSRGPGLGNGKATAILFAREGARVLCVDLVKDRAEETAALLSAEGAETAALAADVTRAEDCRAMVAEARQIMESHGVKLVQAWATLGEYDVVAIIEAPDAKSAAQVSALVAARGNFRAKTLSAVPISELTDAVEQGS